MPHCYCKQLTIERKYCCTTGTTGSLERQYLPAETPVVRNTIHLPNQRTSFLPKQTPDCALGWTKRQNTTVELQRGALDHGLVMSDKRVCFVQEAQKACIELRVILYQLSKAYLMQFDDQPTFPAVKNFLIDLRPSRSPCNTLRLSSQ